MITLKKYCPLFPVVPVPVPCTTFLNTCPMLSQEILVQFKSSDVFVIWMGMLVSSTGNFDLIVTLNFCNSKSIFLDGAAHWPGSLWQSSPMACDCSLLWNSFPVDTYWCDGRQRQLWAVLYVGIPGLHIHAVLACEGNGLVFSIVLLYETCCKASEGGICLHCHW